MNRAAIALGSNLGDRESHLEFAVRRLRGVLSDMRVSSWHETTPVGVASQPDFLNGALTGLTRLSPRGLLEYLLAVEQSRGRVRPHAGAPRTLDLDLILYGRRIIADHDLVVPHPRFRERLFVLEPLAEIAGDWVDPVTGRTVADLLADVRSRGPR